MMTSNTVGLILLTDGYKKYLLYPWHLYEMSLSPTEKTFSTMVLVQKFFKMHRCYIFVPYQLSLINFGSIL